MSEPVETLGDALPKEIAEPMDRYASITSSRTRAGSFALSMMRFDLDAASKAMIEGDLLGMIRAYQSLKGYSA